jgi:hypothetical protein
MTKMFDVRNADAFRRLREAEKIARNVFLNQLRFVPGIFQVPAYAREVISGILGLAADDAEVVERMRIREERHSAFLERLQQAGAPEVHVVLDEAVLRRTPVGSSTMRQQIEHLIEISRRPTVRIGIMPLDHGPHQGLIGSFEGYDTEQGSLVFFEGADDDRVLEDAARVAGYRDLAGSLMSSATSGEDARVLMSKLIHR